MSTQTKEQNALVVVDELVVKQELALVPPEDIKATSDENPEMDKQAENYATELVNYDQSDPASQETRKVAVENMGIEVQKNAANQSTMLKEPIKKLSKKGEDGGEVANALIDLKMKVEELDPGKFDFEAGWFSRMMGKIPGVGSPIKRYFSQYESAQTVINAITRSLNDGKEQLLRDNKTLTQDQRKMREMTTRLIQSIKLAQLIDEKLEYKLDREIDPNDENKVKFVKEELIFPLRQRIMDLQQLLAVNQNGVIAIEIIMRNNKELVRGVDRAVTVTVYALEVAVTVAMALANQKVVLDKIEALNQTTSDLIAGTAAKLRTQGTDIHQRASSAMLNMDTLKAAFADINGAIDDISKFRNEALPRMANNILEMDTLTSKAEESIQKMEKGNVAKPSITIEWE